MIDRYTVESLTIMLTNKCNLNCWMCDFGKENAEEVRFSYSIPETLQILNHRLLKDTLRSVTFTGGEPFLYKDIAALFDAVHKGFPYLNINFSTNAVMLKKMIDVLLKVQNFKRLTIFVSVDGIHKHDEQRGTPGILASVIKTLDTIHSIFPELRIFIKYTITPLNYMDIEDTFDYFMAKGFFTRYKLLECNTCYNNAENYELVKNQLTFSLEQQASIRTQLLSVLNGNSKLKSTIKREIQDIINYFDPSWLRTDSCSCPEKRMFIDNQLNVYTCKEYKPILNLKTSNLDEIPNNSQFLKIVENQEKNAEHCRRCISHMKLVKEDKGEINTTEKKKNKKKKKKQQSLPFYSLYDTKLSNRLHLLSDINDLLKLDSLSQHKKYVRDFEKYFAGIFGAKYAKGVNSGTSALYLALKGIGLKDGDEVITVANTFISTVTAIVQVKAKCIFADIIPETGMMDVEDVKRKITAKTAAIVPVHMYGNMADMAALTQLCRERNIALVEDSCQAIGSSLLDQSAGTWGDVGCYSFHANKVVGFPGDGGMVVTNSERIYTQLVHLAEPGWGRVFNQRQERTPARLAAISIPFIKQKIENLENMIIRGDWQYTLYEEYLKKTTRIKVLQPTKGVRICYRNIILICENPEPIIDILKKNKIPWERLYRQSLLLLTNIAQTADVPANTDYFLRHHIALPIGNHIDKDFIKNTTELILSAVGK